MYLIDTIARTEEAPDQIFDILIGAAEKMRHVSRPTCDVDGACINDNDRFNVKVIDADTTGLIRSYVWIDRWSSSSSSSLLLLLLTNDQSKCG